VHIAKPGDRREAPGALVVLGIANTRLKDLYDLGALELDE